MWVLDVCGLLCGLLCCINFTTCPKMTAFIHRGANRVDKTMSLLTQPTTTVERRPSFARAVFTTRSGVNAHSGLPPAIFQNSVCVGPGDTVKTDTPFRFNSRAIPSDSVSSNALVAA